MRPSFLIPILSILVIFVFACSEKDDAGSERRDGGPETRESGPGPDDRVPGIRLPRIGSLGDYPPPASRAVVNMDAEGRITLNGRSLDLDGLKSAVLPLAERAREPHGAQASRLHAVLRLDRTVPWGAGAWIIQGLADPQVRVYKLHFAALPEEGDEEGTITAFLPKDRGLAPTLELPREDENLDVALSAKGPPVEPAVLYARVKKIVDRSRAEGRPPPKTFLAPDLLVPMGYVIRVLDVLHRAGVEEILFRGRELRRPGQGVQELFEKARSQSATPGIRFRDEDLMPPPGGCPTLPPVARIRRGYEEPRPGEPVAALQAVEDEAMPDILEEEIKPDVLEEEPIEEVPVIRDHRDRDRDRPIEESLEEEGSISDAPFTGPSTNARIGIGGGAGGAFGGRGGHRNLVARGGGGKMTEDAVDLGLEWLKNHQDPAGFWDSDDFMKMDRTTPICDGAGNPMYDPGVSGLALLAFLGAGETHEQGRYKKTVGDGLMHLKRIQDPEGCFSPRTTRQFTYNHAVAALAMAEAFGLTLSPLYKASAQRGVDFIIKCQNPYLAWRYGVRPEDNDTSVSGWMIMALKSAKISGLKVDPAGFKGMKAWLEKATEPEYGRVGYTSRGTGPARRQDLMDRYPADRSESLTAVGILSRIFIGEDPQTSEMIRKGTDLCMKVPPTWDPQDGSIDMYYWYYGTLAIFQVGGPAWQTWNKAMKNAIVPNQRKDGAFRGSWDPLGPWGREGGRVYSTALMVMCMEVYYRYRQVFGLGR